MIPFSIPKSGAASMLAVTLLCLSGGTTALRGPEDAAALLLESRDNIAPWQEPQTQQDPQDRHLQSRLCRFTDIEDDLAEDFDFYTRAGENATSVSCDLGLTDVCTTTIVTCLDVNCTTTRSTEVEGPCFTCTFAYPAGSCITDTCDTSTICPPAETLKKSGRYIESTQGNIITGITREICSFSENPLSCFNVTCSDSVECLNPSDGDNSTTTDGDVVEICREVGRTDSFSNVETQLPTYQGIRYSCRAENKKRTFSASYRRGVANFVDTTLTLGQKEGEGDVEGRFDTCDFSIDGEECNSCAICAPDDFGLLNVDCTNIIEGATTSCDSFFDGLYGIEVERKFWVLQDGYVPPTAAPTGTPTRVPTVEAPTSGSFTPVFSVYCCAVATLVALVCLPFTTTS